MRVQMLRKIGGYRNEVEWPDVGDCLDVPDHEAAGLIAVGYAKEATDANQNNHPDAGSEATDAGEAEEPAAQGDPSPATDEIEGHEDTRPDDAEPGVQLNDDLPPAVDKPRKRK